MSREHGKWERAILAALDQTPDSLKTLGGALKKSRPPMRRGAPCPKCFLVRRDLPKACFF
jgi:hypothetical protein